MLHNILEAIDFQLDTHIYVTDKKNEHAQV